MSERGARLLNSALASVPAAAGDQILNPRGYLDSVFRPAYRDYYKRLVRNSFGVSLGANLIAFEEVYGRPVDLNGDGIVDNEHLVKGFTVTPSVQYNINYRLGMAGSYYYSRKRASAAAGDSLVSYHGGAASVSLKAILLNEEYWKTSDFVSEFFIPSLDFGVALEVDRCSVESVACEDGITRKLSLTPFMDIRASSKGQFRLGLSYRRTRVVGEEDVNGSFTPLLQYVLQFGATR